jgi:hygromycin-B 7''-O-kinase
VALLPPAHRADEYASLARDETRLEAGVRHILRRHGLQDRLPERFPSGSLPAYAIGTAHVLKLYPPCYAFEEPIERACLEAVEGRLGIPTPSVAGHGELDGWRYLLMSRLSGNLLSAVWGDLSRVDHERLMDQLGAALARLHALPSPGPPVPDRDWATFVASQRAGARERQHSRGVEEGWLRQVDPFLGSVDLPQVERKVLLHTEVMREHLLVEQAPEGWRLSGLFDFEPAMLGAPDYEMASVGIFVTRGDGALFRRLLLAYGLPSAELTPARSRRYLAYALLHVYSDLAWYLRLLPPGPDVTTLGALAQRWFGFDGAP